MSVNRLFSRFSSEELLEGEVASELIRRELLANKPSMVARFGSVEIKGVLYPLLPGLLRGLVRAKVLGPMQNNAGFFPATDDSVGRFSRLMLNDMEELDVLGSWRVEERFLRSKYPTARLVALKWLEPYFSESPWTAVLEGMRVLVVHPFSQTIEQQYYGKRKFLFSDSRVLPEFRSLQTVKAVQTIAGNHSLYANWFDALESMKEEVERRDFDVAILGCGAYGFPLAAHIKRLGRKAVHLGGATQILFGIRGRRWDAHPTISELYNEHWIRPSQEDVPEGAVKVENGCYW